MFFELDIEFFPKTHEHDKYPFLRASLDGQSTCGKICEIKYMGAKNFNSVMLTQAPLEHHYPQIQHQLLVTGLSESIYVPYILSACKKKIDSIQYVDVKRDDNYIDNELLPRLLNFWNEVVEWTEKNQPLTP
jgi:predicted phage-related endonuclease